MTGLFLACWTLVTVIPPDGPPAQAGSYRDAEAHAGRGTEGQLRLALWCEAHGLTAEKLRHLARAVLGDPDNAAARALLGLVDDGGKWRPAGAVAARVRADEALSKALAAYNARRDRTPNTADGQWKLALWCEQNGLKAEATAHLVAVTRLDPGHEGAWKRLGYTRHDGVWRSPEQIAAAKAEREAQEKADRDWKPRLLAWKAALGDAARRAEAERSLDAVSDPRAVPAIWQTFVAGKKPDPKRAVVLFGRLDGPAASRALAFLAAGASSPEVRRAARETLRRRDPREFLDTLIGFFATPPAPVAFEYKMIGADYKGSPGYVRVRRGNTVFQQIYTVDESIYPGTWSPLIRPQQINPLAVAGLGAAAQVAGKTNPAAGAALGALGKAVSQSAGQPVLAGYAFQPFEEGGYEDRAGEQNSRITSEAMSARAAATASAQANAAILTLNDETDAALRGVTGSDPGHDAEAWRAWWADQQGYAYERRPPDVRTEAGPTQLEVVTSWIHLSCFAAGTPVRTVGGSAPIETIKVGDLVLAQDTGTGRLSFQPVVAVYHNKPSETLKVRFDSGLTLVATGIHRFWKAGQGWVMARDLKPGDPVRTAGGVDRVASVGDGATQPVFNLEVARGGSFFVGEPGCLVHDNSLVKPVDRPFDAVPDLAAAAPAR